ncbi:MAG: hypothetical protein ACRD5B_13845 [Nitrososphaeraceae archaeon]
MVNLSVTSYGVLLSTGLIADSSFGSTMKTALSVVDDKEKAVIFYTLPRGSINGIFAICFRRSVVDEIGGNLSKIDTHFYSLGIKKNFSEFAAFVNKPKPESLKRADSNGIHIRDLNAIDIDD